MTYYLYILYSISFYVFYIGITSDIERRLYKHNTTNFNTYTKKFRPWIFKALFEVQGTKSDALKMEKFIKRQHSRKLIEKLCDEQFKPKNKLAQLVRVPHLRD